MAAPTKKLTKHGNSLALVIDRGILRLTTDGNAIVATPVRNKASRGD